MIKHLRTILDGYVDLFGETESIQACRIFLEKHKDVTSRHNLGGHLTGSALVWHRSSNTVLRIYHAKIKRWVFSAGGHIDAGEYPYQASMRELLEETGIVAQPLFQTEKPIPLLVDAHPIPVSVKKNEPAHWHYDLIYLYEVRDKPEVTADPTEIAQFKWVPVREVTHANSPIDLHQQMLGYVT